MPVDRRWPRTFALELARALPQGLVDTAAATFAVFWAERVFRAPAGVKVLLVAAPSLGLLLSLFALQVVRRLAWSANQTAALIWAGAAGGFALAAAAGSRLPGYAAGMTLGLLGLSLGAPVLAQVYQTNYPARIRGRLFAFGGMAQAGAAAAAGLLVARHLAADPAAWRHACAGYAAACLAMGGLVLAMPRVPLAASARIRLFDAFRHVRDDPRFRKLLACWKMLGLGNLMAVALFVEYLANPRYGLAFDAARVGLLTTTVPMLALVASIVAWGVLFDRADFYLLRAAINLLFVAAIGCYYFAGSFALLAVGMALHGVARAGGHVAWSLWVTKFARPERVAEYMSVHSFLTGTRGLLAPVLSFGLAAAVGPRVMAAAAITLIAGSTAILAPELRRACTRRPPGPGAADEQAQP